jgi:hypothetical protein
LNAATGGPDLSYLLMAAALLISGLITLAVGAPAHEELLAPATVSTRS